ncbi:MAG TPA: VOC family protein [Bosea sp. (in: a-proteobacteria)]|uniref:VOC family protein n=1 Tax=Bosea sp. (in: a-proteobacteria) TaxID=1871050 RepID=UPI002E11B4B3|nr:VOC family protein [Bosea sp. (in: a-proteobacteria)]
MPAQVPFTLAGLDHVVFRTADTARMLGFYQDVLGCLVERRQDELGLVQLRAGRSLIDLVDVAGPLGRAGGAAPGAEGRNVDHICLGIRPFDEAGLRAHLERHGIAIVAAGSRYGAEGEGQAIYIRDPDGNAIELKGAE